MPVEKIKVKIYGESYILKGDASPEYLEMLAGYVDEKMSYVAERSGRMPSSKVAMLTAINIADELMKLRKENTKLLEILENNDKDEKKEKETDKDKGKKTKGGGRASRKK